MPGPAPKKPEDRVRRNKRAVEWTSPAGWGWQHGDVPELELTEPRAATVRAWDAWFASWWAAFWTPGDLPQLQLAAVLFDQVQAGALDVSKLTPVLDKLGITPKGRKDLLWTIPKEEPGGAKVTRGSGGRYGHLKVAT